MQTVNVAFWHCMKYNSEKTQKGRAIMDEIRTESHEKVRRTNWEVIKEDYLPYLFLMGAAVVCIIFILGALIRG